VVTSRTKWKECKAVSSTYDSVGSTVSDLCRRKLRSVHMHWSRD